MGSKVEIVHGIAGSGKTEYLLNRYRTALEDFRQQRRLGATLWLSPTRRACQAVKDRLLQGDTRICVAPNVLTFEEFAEQVLERSELPIRPLSRSMQRLLLQRIVEEARQKNVLRHFASIADTPGFWDLALAFISELKREEIWPEEFQRTCDASEARQTYRNRNRELHYLYERYQQELVRLDLYDSEGRFWSARELCKEQLPQPFADVAFVVVDGFADFTHTQYEILGYLARDVEQLSISLPLELPLRREELFAKSNAAFEQLRKSLGTNVRIVTPEAQAGEDSTVLPHSTQPAAFRQIAENLFLNPRKIQPIDDATGVELLAATGLRGEVETLARRVKRLLLDGARSEQIVVAYRSSGDYADLVAEIFTAAGIPTALDAGTSLCQTALVKALRGVVEMEQDDWSFDRLSAVLGNNYFRPPDWDIADCEQARRAVDSILRERSLPGGRADILKAIKRQADFERERQEQAEDDELPENRAAEAFGLLRRLDEAAERLRHPASFATWVEKLISLADELGISPIGAAVGPADETLNERDRRVWEVVKGVLFEAVTLDRVLDPEERALQLSEFFRRAVDVLKTQEIRMETGETGKVRVLEVTQARNLDVDYLFLAGLTESGFPSHRSDDCLLGEADRRELNRHGLTLRNRTAHAQEEMLLFYTTVTRARRGLVLSYPAMTTEGHLRFPSPYFAAVKDLFTEQALAVQPVGQLDPVPRPADVMTPVDLRAAAVVAVRENRPGLFRALLAHAETAEAAENILAGTRMAVARFETHGFTEYEGLLHEDFNRAWLANHFDREHEFGATRLERYAQCPFRFLAESLLEVEPLETAEASTDHRRRGIVVHEVLAALHRSITAEGAFDELDDPVKLSARFTALLDEFLRRPVVDTHAERALQKIEESLLGEWGQHFGEHAADYFQQFAGVWNEGPRPVAWEVGFGEVRDEAGEEVAEMTNATRRFPHLTFGSDEEEVRVQGRIDRIDVGVFDDRPVFNVVDYKTGSYVKGASEEDITSGQSLQLVVYLLAVERLNMLDQQAEPFQMGYWALQGSGFIRGVSDRKRTPQPLDPELLRMFEERLHALLPRLVAGIRRGEFPVHNRDEECTKRCGYATVCRVSQVRSLQDSHEKEWNWGSGDVC